MDNIKFKFNKDTNYWKIPFIIIFSVGLIGFIIVSFSNYDDRFTGFTGKLMNYYWVRQFGSFYYSLGTNQLTILVPVTIALITESIYKQKKYKHYWTIYFLYLIFAIYWIYIQYTEIHNILTSEGSWGFGIEIDILLDKTSHLWTFCLIAIINTPIFVLLLLYINLILRKKDNFLTEKYWLKATKSFAFILLSYFVLIIIKQSTGRPEYILTSFEEVVGKITYDKNGKAVDINLTQNVLDIRGVTDIDKLKENILYQINSGFWKPTKYYAWYEINGSWINNLKYWYPWNLVINSDLENKPDGWDIINFPSGHTLATFSLIGYGSIFLFDNKSIKRVWKILFICIWFIHVVMMNFMLCVTMVHYWSDVLFTDLFAPPLCIGIYIVTDKIYLRNISKRSNKKPLINK